MIDVADLAPGAPSPAVQGAVEDEPGADAFPDVQRAVRRLTSARTEQHVSERLGARLQVDEGWHAETLGNQRAHREAVEPWRVVRPHDLARLRVDHPGDGDADAAQRRCGVRRDLPQQAGQPTGDQVVVLLGRANSDDGPRRDLPARRDHGSLRAVREHENCADRPSGAGEPDRSRPLATTCPAGQRSLLFEQPFIEKRLDDLADRRPGGAGQPRELRPGERAVGVESLQHPSTVDLAGPGGGQHRRLARRSTGATGLRDLPSSNREAAERAKLSSRRQKRRSSALPFVAASSAVRRAAMEPPVLDPWFVCTTNNPSPRPRAV